MNLYKVAYASEAYNPMDGYEDVEFEIYVVAETYHEVENTIENLTCIKLIERNVKIVKNSRNNND